MSPNPCLHGIVLFAHGSADPSWSQPIERIATRLRTLAPGQPVVCAYLERMAPDLPTVVAQLACAGASAISVWPMFLGVGRHAREDLPRLLDALRATHPGLSIQLQPAIAEVDAVVEAMAHTMATSITI